MSEFGRSGRGRAQDSVCGLRDWSRAPVNVAIQNQMTHKMTSSGCNEMPLNAGQYLSIFSKQIIGLTRIG